MSLQSKERRSFRALSTLLLILSLHKLAQASSDAKLGVLGGFGGEGINTTAAINDVTIPVKRSDGPFVFRFFYEIPINDRNGICFDHSRGLSLAPFSSGVGFTGLTWHHYFGGLAPAFVPEPTEGGALLVSRYAPFAGVGAGLASGQIVRNGDLVQSITAAGIYGSFDVGTDYQFSETAVARFNFTYGDTAPSTGFVKSNLSELGILIGFYVFY